MNNLNPQQLAELLARKCALSINGHSIEEYRKVGWIQQDIDTEAMRILQSIPLVELLECVKQLERIQRDYRRKFAISASELNNLSTPYDDNLDSINSKLIQILMEG